MEYRMRYSLQYINKYVIEIKIILARRKKYTFFARISIFMFGLQKICWVKRIVFFKRQVKYEACFNNLHAYGTIIVVSRMLEMFHKILLNFKVPLFVCLSSPSIFRKELSILIHTISYSTYNIINVSTS